MNICTNEIEFERRPCVRTYVSPAPQRGRSSEVRAHLRRQRAAEMAAWEFSGGEYLASEFVRITGSQNKDRRQGRATKDKDQAVVYLR